MITQSVYVLIILYIGNIISNSFNLTLPGTVIGIIVMFLLLYSKVLKLHQVEKAGNALIKNMALFFIPPGVKLINSIGFLRASALKIVILLVSTTIITMVVTGKTIDFIIEFNQKKKQKSSVSEGEL